VYGFNLVGYMFRPYMWVIFRPLQRIEFLIAVNARILTYYTYVVIKLQVILNWNSVFCHCSYEAL